MNHATVLEGHLKVDADDDFNSLRLKLYLCEKSSFTLLAQR
jgi:hypothetical protein